MNDNKCKRKNYIPEIAIIRLFLIVLVVLYHSCAIHTGNWPPVGGVIPAYSWIGHTAYSFMLEAFVFISGYLYGVSLRNKNSIELKSEVKKKAKRLLIPCWIFGIFYCILFDQSSSIYQKVFNVIVGEAHLWFLPMLFWCFFATMIFEKFNFLPTFVVPILIVIKISNFMPLPCLFYLPYFYIAFVLAKNGILIKKNILWYTFAFFVLYVLVFLYTTLFHGEYEKPVGESVIMAIARNGCRNTLMFVYTSCGIVFLCFIAKFISSHFILSNIVVRLSGFCFGVYIFQEFILKIMYYYSPVRTLSGMVLPVAGFCITSVFALLSSFLVLKTKIGKYLIG